MSDSETENIFSYPNVNTTVSAKGPKTNISNLSIRQQLTSTMYNMPRNFERQRYAQSVCDQRSMYRRETSPMSTRSAYLRETSPMSIRSACDMRPYNFQPYYSGMSSKQSMYHGRSRSPVSVRSIDSSASVSARDIAFAFKNTKFTSHDLQIIKHAYRNLMKFRTRERFERKRNLRVFLKGNRKNGDDSGEQASDSSISGDDCRSAKTITSKVSNNMPNTQYDFSNLRTVKNNNIGDCGDVGQNTFKNIFSLGSTSMNSNNSSVAKQNNLLKDRFKSSFLLPSQRFNQSVASIIIPENNEKQQKNTMQRVKNHLYQRPNNINSNTDSDDEEIFSETVKENNGFRTESQNKRSLGEDELNLPYNKRKKISSPIKNISQNIAPLANNNSNKIINNFEFLKPALPTKKIKPKTHEKLISKSAHPKEKLIAKSSQPLTDIIEPGPCKAKDTAGSSQQPNVQEKADTVQTQPVQHETMDNTDVSLRPSFIKRKLFTQKLDVIEKCNVSSDGVNSPQSSAYQMPKEKNKARKLVTTQSCLNRDIQDDNNLLDLIHKIVPPDQMNATSQSSVNLTRSNVTKPVANESEKKDDDKWDITAVISMCNDNDCSDTYSDEEIFKSDDKITDDPTATKKSLIYPCSVDLIKMPIDKNELNNRFKANDATMNKLQNCAKSFWDTDTESDFEWPYYKSNIKENQRPGNTTIQQENKNPARNIPSTKTTAFPDITKSLYNTAINTTINSTIDNAQKIKVGSFRSHRLSKKKKCCNEACADDTNTAVEIQKRSLTDKTKPIRNPPKTTPPKSKSKSESQHKNKPTKDNNKTKSTEASALTRDGSASNTHKKIKPKPEDNNKTANNKSKPKSDTHNKVEKSVKQVLNKSPKTKATKAAERNNNDVKNKNINTSNPHNTNSVLDSTVESVQNNMNSTLRQRPLRSCRATSQNRSIASNSLQMGNDSCFSKSLRSRTINLSSSIENISLHIKPRCKAVNKTIAQINSRKSDVSFSLGNKNTPKKMTRNKGKR